MRIGVLTSSRADFSIYLPLLRKMKVTDGFISELIVFGTHLSERHGYTLKQIEQEGFTASFCINGTTPELDTPQGISKCMGVVIQLFSDFWNEEKFDLVFALGDRFEMFAACLAALPFKIKIAHIHGGEKTAGAIDDVLRHSITHMADIHFTAAEEYKKRVVNLIESDKYVFNVGAMSFENLKNTNLLSIAEFKSKFNIDISKPSILITFHPETVSFEENECYINELIKAMKEINGYQLIITMPNQDTMGDMIRMKLIQFINDNPEKAIGIESFGTLGYLSCMKHCSFLIGNTSSGFGEASYFPKYVINLGKRQSGRILTSNINSISIKKEAILKAVKQFENQNLSNFKSVYGNGNSSELIINYLKELKW
jgi:GDP/UDP-N,N'-diacetylbacillosamine 2-epimerase (hydrolysing)